MAEESSEEEPEQLQCKLIILGDGAVGKTSVALRFTEDYFATQYKQTIGLDFFMKRMILPGAPANNMGSCRMLHMIHLLDADVA